MRIDSGDLAAMASKVRAILDAGGLKDVIILVSGGINEDVLQTMMATKAPDRRLRHRRQSRCLDRRAVARLRLQAAGICRPARRKLSEGKATWPGRKQVWRSYGADGRMRGDVLSLESDSQPGETLIVPVMRGGKRVARRADLDANPRACRARTRAPAGDAPAT